MSCSYLWFVDYLSGRSQQVCFCSKLSEPGPVVVGVPQGSILGPLLFSIYINDLPRAVSFCNVDQYADDTLISYSNPSFSILEARLQNDVNSIVNWLIANKFWINVSKTEAMVVGSRQRVGNQHLSVVIDNKPIRNVYVAKYLGVQIDQCLTWRNHVDYVLSKARRKWYCIKHLQWMSSYLFGLLYQVFIIPLFDYCDVVWCPSATQLKIFE